MVVSSNDNLILGEAILTTCYILNRISHKYTKVTPFGLWKYYKPNLNYLKVWDYLPYVWLNYPKRLKLGARASTYVFVGYSLSSNAYRYLDLENNMVIESLDAIFHEDKFIYVSRNSKGQEITNDNTYVNIFYGKPKDRWYWG